MQFIGKHWLCAAPLFAGALMMSAMIDGQSTAHAGDIDASCSSLDPLQGGSPIITGSIGLSLDAGDTLVVESDFPFRIGRREFRSGGRQTFTAEAPQEVFVSILRLEDEFFDQRPFIEVSCVVGGLLEDEVNNEEEDDEVDSQADVAVSSLAQNRGRTTLSNLPGLAEQVFLSDGNTSVSGAAQGNNVFFSAHIAPEEGTLEDMGVWARGVFTDYEFGQGANTVDGQSFVFQAGVDYKFTPKVAVGIMGQADFIAESAPGVDTSDGQGFLVGPYVTVNVVDDVYVEALAMLGRANNQLTNAAGASTDYASTRFLVSGRVFGHFHFDRLQVEPAARFTYYTERSDSFTEGNGVFVAASTDSLGQFRVGPKLGYQLGDRTFGAVPFVKFEGVYNFTETGAANTIADVEGLSGSIGAGLDMVIDPATFRAEIRYDGLGDSDFEALSGSLLVEFPFGG